MSTFSRPIIPIGDFFRVFANIQHDIYLKFRAHVMECCENGIPYTKAYDYALLDQKVQTFIDRAIIDTGFMRCTLANRGIYDVSANKEVVIITHILPYQTRVYEYKVPPFSLAEVARSLELIRKQMYQVVPNPFKIRTRYFVTTEPCQSYIQSQISILDNKICIQRGVIKKNRYLIMVREKDIRVIKTYPNFSKETFEYSIAS